MPKRRATRPGTILAIVVLALVVFAGVGYFPTTARAAPIVRPSHAAGPAAAGFQGDVTWNGVDVSTAGTDSSAIAIDFSATAALNYTWTSPATAPVTINDARLQMFYFGFAVATRDVYVNNPPTSSNGIIHLDWTPVSIAYVLEGLYLLTASIIASNGTTMWSENFYVKGNAPLGFVAVIPIVLLILLVYEVYALARSGRYAALGRKEPPSQPPQTPPSSPGGGATPPPSTETPVAEAPEEPAETPPATEGGGS